ncbi:MAG TPA: MG2 domain-containing protein [Gemmatimonadales bacterium]|nr:MG2 domain-containing protein [Gemmatimonadales bacterium]
MLSIRLAAVLLAGAVIADRPPPLRVLRVVPTGDADPTARVMVTFDRPVAGSLDRTVDPAAILRIEPAVAGRIEWQNPITIRFTPAAPLAAGTEYVVTIADGFEAMDGSRLEEPYRFSFRVRGPRVLSGAPVRQGNVPRFLTPDQRFELVVSAPADLAVVARTVHLDFLAGCPQAGIVRLRATGQRRITERDPWDIREAGGWDRDRALDSLRRVVQLAPERPLPRGCEGQLVVPARLDRLADAALPERWSFHTYGDFRLARAACGWGSVCPTGPVVVHFTTPVRGAEVQRRVRILPAVPFTVRDTSEVLAEWVLDPVGPADSAGRRGPPLRPRTAYAVVADTALRDVFGQPLGGNPVATFLTTGYEPGVEYPFGRLVVERDGRRTLMVKHVNVDTLEVIAAPVTDSMEARFLARSPWGWGDLWGAVAPRATRTKIAVRNERDRVKIYGVRLPAPDASRPGAPTLYAVKVTSPTLSQAAREAAPIALVQVTDLGVHARIGLEEGAVWVTSARQGTPVPGALVTLHDANGRTLGQARTDARGLARLSGFRRPPHDEDDWEAASFDGYVAVRSGGDRALVGVSQYDPDLSPWRFDVSGAWGAQRMPLAGAVFTERGIYRPGEPLHAKAIVRRGSLGTLRPPGRADSVRWIFHARDGGVLRDTTVALSRFGTADHSISLPTSAPLGHYRVEIQAKHGGAWQEIASAGYRVAEYRPPEFLVDVHADPAPRFAGDSLRTAVEARYLFGAPMARAAMTWSARRQSLSPWELEIPDAGDWYIGETGLWGEAWGDGGSRVEFLASGADTLDAAGRAALALPVTQPPRGRPARVTVEATVTDVNRRTVSAAASVVVHPAAFYLGARAKGDDYFWTAGRPRTVEVIALGPDGRRVPGVAVRGAVVRREWHQVRRERDGLPELVGEWVSDTVARCSLTTTAEPAACRFTPALGGEYLVGFTARDAAGRETSTSFLRWAAGPGWVPWNDETQFKMEVIPDRARYSVGDTATVLLASPFTGVEAWVTVEREGLIAQRRIRIADGATRLRFPITEAFAPNAYVSVLVARGRSAPPGPLDDPGRPTIRVGYAELRVTPEVKRLEVALEPVGAEYRPGDTATVRIRVRDRRGKGAASEVTLWAVDEGVLALTGYRTPDPLDLLYRRRGLGLRLASNLVSVAPQVPEGEKGRREAGGGGGLEGSDVLRSRFQPTAFFLGSVLTDSAGVGLARAKLPDNLTTFRVMAVAVTAGDRYGSGQSSLLVTRPLVARPALPRFLREGDRFAAGVVVNRRAPGPVRVSVSAEARGVRFEGERARSVDLAPGRGREVRFDFAGAPGDTAVFRFGVKGGGEADAVEHRLPIRPAHTPRAHTIAGVLRDTASATFTLPGDIDPSRSTLELSLGTSPLGAIRAVERRFRVYPYHCTEQVTSTARALVALYRAQRALGTPLLEGDPRAELERAAAILLRRQRGDGGIGYWGTGDWSTPWLSAYAGAFLLEARDAGIAVSDSALGRLAEYLTTSLRRETPVYSAVALWYGSARLRLADRIAAVDFLSRLGRPDAAAENELLRLAPQMAWEDRAWLAEVLARRKAPDAGRRLLAPIWSAVRVEGRTAVVPRAEGYDFYFASRQRPAARLLLATLAVEPEHPLVGPLVETLVQQGRVDAADGWIWNTQDYAFTVAALVGYHERLGRLGERPVGVQARGRTLIGARSGPAGRDSSVSLAGLLEPGPGGSKRLALRLAAGPGAGPVYYFLTVREVPGEPPTRPDQAGIQVERWYERLDSGRPVVSAPEGELVRVRLRITVPADRHFVVLDDPLPAGLEAVDLSLRTAGGVPGPGTGLPNADEPAEGERAAEDGGAEDDGLRWRYGTWDAGWWSPFDHREMRDDRVVYFATVLWKGTYTATYLARATTPGVFVRPPAHAEEMYNPAVHGRSDGGVFTVTARP